MGRETSNKRNCADCFNSYSVISENGIHHNCGLSEECAVECLCGRVDHYDSFARMREENKEIKE